MWNPRSETLNWQKKLLETELKTAEAIQRVLLRKLPDCREISIATYFQASRFASGDGYGFCHDASSKTLLLWIGDVTGHGVSSAIVTAVMFGVLRYAMKNEGLGEPLENRLTRIMEVANSAMLDIDTDKYMTLLLVGINLTDGSACFINAGHPMAQILHGGFSRTVKSIGNPLGFSISSKYSVCSEQIQAGNLLFLHTDGLTENQNADGLRLNRSDLYRLLRGSTCETEMISKIRSAIEFLQVDQDARDDITMLGIRWEPNVSETLTPQSTFN